MELPGVRQLSSSGGALGSPPASSTFADTAARGDRQPHVAAALVRLENDVVLQLRGWGVAWAQDLSEALATINMQFMIGTPSSSERWIGQYFWAGESVPTAVALLTSCLRTVCSVWLDRAVLTAAGTV